MKIAKVEVFLYDSPDYLHSTEKFYVVYKDKKEVEEMVLMKYNGHFFHVEHKLSPVLYEVEITRAVKENIVKNECEIRFKK